MSTDLAVRETDSWAEMLPAVNLLSEGVANTAFVPRSLKGDKYAVAACVLAGRELGLGPMESLQKIYIVEGKPSLSAELMRSLVLRAGHEIRFEALTDAKVILQGRRHGDGEWTTVTWTMQDAQRIGVAGKDNWKKYPRAMLANRATSELCRLIFPDALGGFTYTPEEVEDDLDEPAPKAKRTTVQRAKAPAPTEPPLDDGAESEDVTDAELLSDAVSGEQRESIRALMAQIGMTERDKITSYVSGVVGRPVENSDELTTDEADLVIAALIELAALGK